MYIITTARKRDTNEWEAECSKFGLSENVFVDSWNNIHKYEKVTDALFIFDEQRVVGSGAWVKSFIKITKSNRWLLLSATPGDTWSDYIPVFVANGFYKNRTEFMNRHAVYNRFTKFPKVDRFVEVGRLEALRRKITVVMAYRRPTVRHSVRLVAEYDKTLFRTVSAARWNPYEDQPILDIAGTCYLMRRVVNSDPRRLDKVYELLKEHPKMIIFYNFDYELEILRSLSPEYTIAEWNGHKHELIPKTESWVYLVQYMAGAEGWNCIETDTMVFYSENYSYKLMEQAAGRIDRLNTPYLDLYYYTITSLSPIDQSISRALRHKRNFNESAFFEASNFA